jgi:inosine/xanthosine triphosphate pyrophosphatase family protein
MSSPRKTTVVYATSSQFKKDENAIFVEHYRLPDGTLVKDLFEFDIRGVEIKEVLEVDISAMVSAEVIQAYSRLRVPCIVEHAGLIFEDYREQSYPGGLTKPMWNTLRDNFVTETRSAKRRAIARAVVAYCDGRRVQTFIGDTQGIIAESPRGATHRFYWDTVFIPDDPGGLARDMTYSQIVETEGLGLHYKVTQLSQSSKAMCKLLEYIRVQGPSPLWGRFPA